MNKSKRKTKMTVEEFIAEACKLNKKLDESSGKPSTSVALNAVKSSLSTPEDVEKFMSKHAS